MAKPIAELLSSAITKIQAAKVTCILVVGDSNPIKPETRRKEMEELKKLQKLGEEKGLQVFLANPYGLGRFVVHNKTGDIIFESRTAKAVLSFISKHQ